MTMDKDTAIGGWNWKGVTLYADSNMLSLGRLRQFLDRADYLPDDASVYLSERAIRITLLMTNDAESSEVVSDLDMRPRLRWKDD